MRADFPVPRSPRRRIIIISAFVLLVILFYQAVDLYTDALWFSEVGQLGVFTKLLSAKIILALIAGLIFAVFVYVNTFLARRFSPKWQIVYEEEVLEVVTSILGRMPNLLFLGISLLAGLIAGIAAFEKGDLLLRYLDGVAFGIKDPVFSRDLGFYFFTLPFYESVYRYLMPLLVVSLIMTALAYVAEGGITIRLRRFGISVASQFQAHALILLTLIFALKAGGYRLLSYELLYSPRGAAFGASFTDVNAQLPVLNILVYISAVTALLFIVGVVYRNWWTPLIGIILLLGVSVVGGNIYPAVVQRYRVSPNELGRERLYIQRNIDFTRKAYGVDEVKEQAFPVEEQLTLQDLEDNEATIQNIRLWDWRPLLKTYSQLQEIRTYYQFRDVDVDRYFVDGEYRQVMLSARELSREQLAPQARTWVNEHLVFTHGYGVVLSPVNEISEEGLPKLLVKDIPPASEHFEFERPEIYFGEATDDFVLVKSRQREFDFPMGDENQYTTYEGSGGIRLSSSLRKAAFAWRFGSLQLFLSEAITPQTRIMFNRQIRERVRKIAPFLSYDRDPYMVVADGRLHWVIDAYTVSDRYPYSEPFQGGQNYIRNSVKVVVDAYNGTVRLYVMDDKDPVLKTYRKIFPNLFTPLAKMPESLKSHLRYPEDLFIIQARIYAKYHMKDPSVFYNREDLWSFPQEIFESSRQEMDPYYLITRLPGEDLDKFLLFLPFTPFNKNNMIAWLSASSDFPDYGRLLVFKFPKQKLVFGPMQIETRIEQDAEISQQLSLWRQRGSQVIRGNLLVIPVKDSLLYVEPLYLQAEESQFPELKRVLVVHRTKIAMEENLEKALAVVFGQEDATPPIEAVAETPPAETGAETPPPADETELQSLAREASESFERAQEHQQKGDWAAYGEELEKLEEILGRLSALSDEE